MNGTRARQTDARNWLWDVIERSDGGHERRRRLGWRMTEEQARQWEFAHGGKLERFDEAEAGVRSVEHVGRARSAK